MKSSIGIASLTAQKAVNPAPESSAESYAE
jgi:hypothetical protein